MTYEFLQAYWWFLISLLGALLVFLMFVQGANTLIFCLGGTSSHHQFHRKEVGVYLYHPRHIWRSVLRIISSLL